MGIGIMRTTVLDVNDLAVAEQFWCQVTGLALEFSGWQGRFSRVGEEGPGSILLQLVSEPKTAKNRAHLDFTVDDVARAVAEVARLGGTVVKPPGVFPEHEPRLEWAVVADPFGNEFCLIRDV